MTQDNGMDNPADITKGGLLAAIDTAIDLLPRYQDSAWQREPVVTCDVSFCKEYLERLKSDIENDRWKNE